MVGLKKCSALLLLVISTVTGENCVTYDFGEDFYNTFNNGKSICGGMESWSLGNYSDVNVVSPHEFSSSFISPGDSLSCVSSYSFEMRSTGVLEVHVYMDSVSQRDQIVVLAKESRLGNNDAVTGTAMLTPLSGDYVNGWHVLRIDLFGTGIFNGYVTFLGLASPGSTIIIDSFRYIPPQYEDECFLYDVDFVPPTAPPPTAPTECITYDFETKFEEVFNSNRGLCTGFSEWKLLEYYTIPLDNPTSDSKQFIAPQSNISCVSSFPFKAESGGTIEVNVYMESQSDSDQIAVLVNQIFDENNDAVTGSVVLTPLLPNYVDGWQVLRIELSGHTAYDGYISFLGLAAEDSIVLIDSFRYIPPSVDIEECSIYSEDMFATTTPIPITTPPPTGQDCVTFNFESNLDVFDTNSQLCSGYADWHLGTYYSLNVDTLYPESTTFISPNVSSSCISSFVFEMKPEGRVEVNVFMKSVSELDYVIVLAKKLVPGGIDTVAGLQLYYASNAGFVEGWNVLTVSVLDFQAFKGYITLMGSMSEDSIVLIDSFRYIPPNYDDPCKIY
ncbi:uncharacterized protein LOC142978951 [Anticarsia gemmatalis]|uniref:uncharacterized protein LOC142978951 n=1 Tax=Anticarsia gemmatalis TaxID=129554 RepID=UPI003F76B7E6